MKLLSIALGASLLASPAFAAGERSVASKHASDACKTGHVKQVLSCHAEKPTRASKSVEIRECGGKLIGSVSMPGMTDKPVESASAVVTHAKPEPHRLGAPAVYKGADFDLTINWTTSPSKNGGHLGHFKSKALTADLICTQATKS